MRKLADISYKEALDLLPRLGAPCEPMGGEKLFIEITPNRPDLLSIEGVARLINDYKSKSKNRGNINFQSRHR